MGMTIGLAKGESTSKTENSANLSFLGRRIKREGRKIFLFTQPMVAQRRSSPRLWMLKETDFVKFAEGMDRFGIRVQEASQIRTTLTQAFPVADPELSIW
jgi:hypothetical protein